MKLMERLPEAAEAISDAFLTAVAANTRSYYWAGTITTTAGKVYELGYSDILKGSGYISSQCCGSTEIELGTVYQPFLPVMTDIGFIP
ncbi:MAG: hypothetical protein LUF27_06430 [Lachnospiraceae bacterium]|nr:hypothetical protein [Lachnospiraceae bacterium]